MVDDRLALVQSFFTRYFQGDIDGAVTLLEPTVVYHVPGRIAPAGDFVGPAAVAKHLRKFLELTGDAIDVLSWDDWLIGTTDIAGVVRVHLQRPGRVRGVPLRLSGRSLPERQDRTCGVLLQRPGGLGTLLLVVNVLAVLCRSGAVSRVTVLQTRRSPSRSYDPGLKHRRADGSKRPHDAQLGSCRRGSLFLWLPSRR